jgi:hypothetical protein
MSDVLDELEDIADMHRPEWDFSNHRGKTRANIKAIRAALMRGVDNSHTPLRCWSKRKPRPITLAKVNLGEI